MIGWQFPVFRQPEPKYAINFASGIIVWGDSCFGHNAGWRASGFGQTGLSARSAITIEETSFIHCSADKQRLLLHWKLPIIEYWILRHSHSAMNRSRMKHARWQSNCSKTRPLKPANTYENGWLDSVKFWRWKIEYRNRVCTLDNVQVIYMSLWTHSNVWHNKLTASAHIVIVHFAFKDIVDGVLASGSINLVVFLDSRPNLTEQKVQLHKSEAIYEKGKSILDDLRRASSTEQESAHAQLPIPRAYAYAWTTS